MKLDPERVVLDDGKFEMLLVRSPRTAAGPAEPGAGRAEPAVRQPRPGVPPRLRPPAGDGGGPCPGPWTGSSPPACRWWRSGTGSGRCGCCCERAGAAAPALTAAACRACWAPGTAMRSSAPWRRGPGGPELLFEVRSAALRRQPGEVCFPGGPDGGGGDAGGVRPPGDGGGAGHSPAGDRAPGPAGLHLQPGGLSPPAGAGVGIPGGPGCSVPLSGGGGGGLRGAPVLLPGDGAGDVCLRSPAPGAGGFPL